MAAQAYSFTRGRIGKEARDVATPGRMEMMHLLGGYV